MKTYAIRSALIGAVGAALALSVGDAAAASFTFINIADTSEEGPFQVAGFGVPALNNSGTVAFSGLLRAGGSGIFTSSGGRITTLYDTSGPFSRLLDYPPLTINDSGTVAFTARLDTGLRGVFTGSGGPTTTIVNSSGPLGEFFFSPSLNERGTVAFGAAGGIFTSSGGPITTIAEPSGPLGFASEHVLNDSGTVAFLGGRDTGGEGIFTGSGGAITTIADTSGPFDFFDDPLSGCFVCPRVLSFNDSGTVAFFAGLDTGGAGIFTGSGGAITTIADSSGPFGGFSGPALNDSGTVAFLAGTAVTGKFGLFIGPDPVADEVISVGDPLFGSTLRRLILPAEGLNNNGQIVFLYELANGLGGIALANPRAIPEPGTLALLGLSLLGLGLTRRCL